MSSLKDPLSVLIDLKPRTELMAQQTDTRKAPSNTISFITIGPAAHGYNAPNILRHAYLMFLGGIVNSPTCSDLHLVHQGPER